MNVSKMWKSEFDLNGCYSIDASTESMDADSIMKEIQRLYSTRKYGLRDTAKFIPSRSIQAITPRNKVTVLIVGSHNVAKQKFLDLYFNDTRNKAANDDDGFVSRVNYDKLDKIYVTHGNRRQLLVGESVLDYCPHLSFLRNIPGVKDYLTTEISTRNTKSLVSFILAPESIHTSNNNAPIISDSAENVDENNNASVTKKRSLDMRQAIGKLTEAADLIFIFFDPTGTIPPRETLQPFEHIWNTHHEKILFLLARAEVDETDEETRESVLTQIVREIWKNPTVRRVGYLPEIFCPDLYSGIRDDQRLWSIIQNTADQSIDKALVQLEHDATAIKERLETMRKENNKAKQNDGKISSSSFLVMALIVIAVCWGHTNEFMNKVKDQDAYEICKLAARDKEFLAGSACLTIIYMAYSLFANTKRSVLSDEEETMLDKRIDFANYALQRKKEMGKIFE